MDIHWFEGTDFGCEIALCGNAETLGVRNEGALVNDDALPVVRAGEDAVWNALHYLPGVESSFANWNGGGGSKSVLFGTPTGGNCWVEVAWYRSPLDADGERENEAWVAPGDVPDAVRKLAEAAADAAREAMAKAVDAINTED